MTDGQRNRLTSIGKLRAVARPLRATVVCIDSKLGLLPLPE